jgi:hypothetical protein
LTWRAISARPYEQAEKKATKLSTTAASDALTSMKDRSAKISGGAVPNIGGGDSGGGGSGVDAIYGDRLVPQETGDLAEVGSG